MFGDVFLVHAHLVSVRYFFLHKPLMKLFLRSKNLFQFRIRFGLCSIPAFEVTNRGETEVCIAFIHRKSGKFLRF
jgi:hypothetical protein